MEKNEVFIDFQIKFLEMIQCPISLEAFEDPVILIPTGIIYNRKAIEKCEEKLNIPLREFVDISLKAMQNISDTLEL